MASIGSAYFTKEKTCAFQLKDVQGRTASTTSNDNLRTSYSIMGGFVEDRFDMKMVAREDVNTWGSTCNGRRIIVKSSTTDLTFQVVDRAYYWWLFFSYWQWPLGSVKCTDKKPNKCTLNSDVNAKTFGDPNWFFISNGLIDYTCLPGFFGGKEELVTVFNKATSTTTAT